MGLGKSRVHPEEHYRLQTQRSDGALERMLKRMVGAESKFLREPLPAHAITLIAEYMQGAAVRSRR